MKKKGLFHIHSSWSYDSEQTLEQIKSRGMELGCSFAILCEHDRDFPWSKTEEYFAALRNASNNEFIFIAGLEYDFDGIHLLCFGAERYFPASSIKECLSACREEEGICVWAHPRRKDISRMLPWFKYLDGLEVWSSRYGCPYVPAPGLVRVLDNFRQKNDSFCGYAGMDAHRVEQIKGPMLEVDLSEFSLSDIKNALKQGDFRSESGPIIIDARGEIWGWYRPFRTAIYYTYRLLDLIIP